MLTHDNYLEQAQVLGAHVPDAGGRPLLLGPADQPRDRLHVRDGRPVPVRRRGRAPAHAAPRVPRADDEALRRHAHRARAAHPARAARAHRGAARRAARVAAPRDRRADRGQRARHARAPNQRLSSALLEPHPRPLRRPAAPDRRGRRVRRAGARRVLLPARLPGRDRLRPDRGVHRADASTTSSRSAPTPWAGRSPASSSSMRDAGPDGVGEVCVRGRTIMRGYLDAASSRARRSATAGCARATSARSTRRVTSAWSAAPRT